MGHVDLTAWGTAGMFILAAITGWVTIRRTISKDRDEQAAAHKAERENAFDNGATDARRQADMILDGLRQTIQAGEVVRAEQNREIQYLKERIDDLTDQLRRGHG